VLGLRGDVRGCLFDLDGVLTQTAKVHGAAWTAMFDAYLREHARQTGQPFVAFEAAD
jgi:beta-phosphoglucomutase-like phosphatase (HAD superfamily)